MVGSTSDITEKYLTAVKVAGLGMGQVDYVADTIALDARAAEIFDLPAETPMLRDTLHRRIHRADRERIDYQVDVLLDPHRDNYIDVQHRVVHDNGAIRWVSARKQITFAGTTPVSGVVAIMDISDHKAAQDHNAFLMDELNHRSRNLLTVVQGIIRRTLRSGERETFEQRLSQRLEGLMRNAESLSKQAWRHADLRQLAHAQLTAFLDVDGPRLSLVGGPMKVKSAGAQAIGMAFHELATNAVKYGALSGSEGRITIAWGPASQDDGMSEISWTEVGGPPVSPPAREGFGQTVITDLAAAAVDGTVELTYLPEGVIWRLRLPESALG